MKAQGFLKRSLGYVLLCGARTITILLGWWTANANPAPMPTPLNTGPQSET